jgi:hypothetical protein
VLDRRPCAPGTDEAFWNFQLAAVRRMLAGAGWRTRVIASVNNLRRWDRRLPASAVRVLRPVAYCFEAVAQRCGRRWWGPSQFVLARRDAATVPAQSAGPRILPPGVPGIAHRMVCPDCSGRLTWTATEATCDACHLRYPKVGAHWDFAVRRSG